MKLYQLELDQTDVNCGMSYIFQLDDQSYFIIDGGYFTPGEDSRLLAFLRAHTDATRPLIRGWLFTHGHQDHIGCFMNFILHYINEVVIETLYFNFQPLDLNHVTGAWTTKCNDLATVKKFYEIIETLRGRIPVQSIRSGDQFWIGPLFMEVLSSPDNILQSGCSFNEYSIVLRVTYGGQSLLFLGDAQEICSDYLLEHEKDSLKSTFVQVAHHGFHGATEELYAAIQPEVVLFPCPESDFEMNRCREVNRFILNELGIKEFFVSGCGTCEFSLPYKIGTAKQYERQIYSNSIPKNIIKGS